MNKMKEIRIEKVVLNIGCGANLKTEDAKTILERVSNDKAVVTKARKRSTFGVPKGKEIGCKVVKRKETHELLKRLLEAKENKLKASSFDDTGNVSFGIKEYIEVPGMEYDPSIGIIGFDVAVTLERPGYSVKKKRIPGKIGKKHLITREDAMNFMKEKFGVVIE